MDENAVNIDSASEQHEHGVIERIDLLRIAPVIDRSRCGVWLWLELLTGDTQHAADELGKQAFFDRVSGRMLPEGKLCRVDVLITDRRTVL